MRKTSLPNLVRAPRNVLKLGPGTPRFGALNHQPSHSTSLIPYRTLAQVRSDREVFSEIWFTSSSPPRRVPEDGGIRPNDVPPPDERTLKLGKSMPTPWLENVYTCLINHPTSPSNPPIPPPLPPRLSPPPRNPLPPHNSPPLPFHPPAPSHRLRPRSLSRRSLDRPHGLGSRPHSRQRKTNNSLRARRQKRPTLQLLQRAPHRALEDLREDEGEGNGCLL